MAEICWLASYPKSGNTWLRAFMVNYLRNPPAPASINDLAYWCFGDGLIEPYEVVLERPAADLDERTINQARPKVQHWFTTRSPDTVFVKTHNAVAVLDGVPTIAPESTFAAVYVVRNPLDVAVSYANHFSIGIDTAVETLGRAGNFIAPHANQVYQHLGSWSEHVKSWVDAPGMLLHTMRYEDMLTAPIKTFGQLVDFMRLPQDRTRLKKAIRFSSFRELRKQEKAGGFQEAVPDRNAPDRKRAFFQNGRAGGWRQRLNDAQVEKIIADQCDMMIRFGYLGPDGEPKP